MDKRITLDEAYMQMAEIWATRSYAVRKKVGCLVVKENRIIADGYNGTPRGFDNCCEIEVTKKCETSNPDNETYYTELVTSPLVMHSELNALMKLAKSTESSEGSTMYVTMSPCHDCAKIIIQAGIVKVVYRERYRITDGLDLLEKAGILVVKL